MAIKIEAPRVHVVAERASATDLEQKELVYSSLPDYIVVSNGVVVERICAKTYAEAVFKRNVSAGSMYAKTGALL